MEFESTLSCWHVSPFHIRSFSLDRRNKPSFHGDDSNESSDSSAFASVDARSRLSSSTRRQHERRLRKQRQLKQQQKQSMRHHLPQPDDLFVTPTSKSTHSDSRGVPAALSKSGEDIPCVAAVTPKAKSVASSTRVDSRTFNRRRGKRSMGGSRSIFSSPVRTSGGASCFSTSGDDYYDTSSSSTDSDSYTTDRSEEFQSSSEASSLSSSDSDGSTGGSHCESDIGSNSHSDGGSVVGGTPTSQRSVSVCTRGGRGSGAGVGSRSLASNCWSDGVFESSTDSTPPRARRTKGAAAAVPSTNNLPAIPLPIPAFAANSNRRGVTPQEVPSTGEMARGGGRVEMDLGAMAISLLNRGSRTQPPHRSKARMLNSEAREDGVEGRGVVLDRNQDQTSHRKGVGADTGTGKAGTVGNVPCPSPSHPESDMPFVGVVRDGSQGTMAPWGPDFVYGHELSEQASSSSSSESMSMYDGFDSEPERTAPRERDRDMSDGDRRVNDGGKFVDGSREAGISPLENDSTTKVELEEVAVSPAGKDERVDVYETRVDAEGENEGVKIAKGSGRKKRGKGKGVGRAIKAAAAAIAGRLETNKKRNQSMRVVVREDVGDTGDSDGLSLPPYDSRHSASKETLHGPDQPENQDQTKNEGHRSQVEVTGPSSSVPSGVWKPPRRRWRGLGGGGWRESKLRDRREVEEEISMIGTSSVHVV